MNTTNNNNVAWLKQSLTYNEKSCLKWNKKYKGVDLWIVSDGKIYYTSNPYEEIPQETNKNGYKYVSIYKSNGDSFDMFVHHIMAYTYLYNDIKKFKELNKGVRFEINHKDGNILNNHISNLNISTIELNRINRKK